MFNSRKGSSDCGLFAISFAVEVAFNGIECAMGSNFKQTHMRAHLEKCITGEHFEPFPKTEGCNEVTNTKETIYKVVMKLLIRKIQSINHLT